MANYYTEGMYAIDVAAIDEKDVVAFKEVLAIKNFWCTDELEREFQRVCVNSSANAFNSAAFKRLVKINIIMHIVYGIHCPS